MLPEGVAKAFRRSVGGLAPQFGGTDAKPTARVLLPERATAPLHIEEAASDLGVDVWLAGGRDVAAAVADGYAVYERGHASGATLLHRALPDGVEDFISFENRPASAEIAYDIGLGLKAEGMRLVDRTLEVLDADGTPRLRVSPPYVVGADGVRTEAALTVEGCAVDTNPAAPWERALTAAGAKRCIVRVTWNDTAVAYPAILDPRWTSTSSMGTARQEHTMTRLASGKVLVAGGRSTNSSTAALGTAELFDPATGTWATTGAMAGARRIHRAVQLGSTGNSTTSGKVLVVGGINNTTSLSTAELYSPTTGTWIAAASLPTARHEGTATLLGSGQVLVAGGLSGTTVLNTAVRYNPASGAGSWTGVANMASARRSHTATLLTIPGNSTLNNKVLVVGGNSGTASLTSVQLFDGTSAWTTLTALTTAREGHTATALVNGNVLIVGGVSGTSILSSTLLFNAASGAGSFASAGAMTSARNLHSATLLGTAVLSSGQVLVAGGTNGTTALSSAELWNGSSTWTATSTLPAAVQGHTASLIGNNVLIAGGLSGTTVQSAARIYDPSFGLTCMTDSQCSSGRCLDGVCCATACAGTCMSCNVPGSVGTCAPKPNGTTCDDGNACTTGETCLGGSQAGTCGGGGAVTCPGADQCNIAGVCLPATGCQPPTPKTEGTSCDDGHACTVADSCQAGTCQGSATNSCSAAVMDFDTLGTWSYAVPNGTIVGLNTNHTQGTSSLEVKPHGFAPLLSLPQSSLGEAGPLALLDIMLPALQPNPSWYGLVQLYISIPSAGINHEFVGQVELTGLPLATWQTVAIQLSPAMAAKLSGTYSDLTFDLTLNVPEEQTASYLLDNLRFVSDVIPTLLGIATNSAGLTKAIFQYTTTNVTSISIPYGPANSLSNTAGFIPTPTELPPQVFVPAPHAPFLATLGPNQLTWKVGSHSVTATAQSAQLPSNTSPDGTRVVTLPDGTKINVDSVPPQDPVAATDPALGARFYGTIPAKLDVSPSGAAVYSVPIALPPGIAGMAPNLSLVYNSQGGDGLAGEGWELAGLSSIHRCPKTRVQDGLARPITMASLETPPSSPPTGSVFDSTVDGLCLDGKRLFQKADGTYHLEADDFSVITGHTDVFGSVAPQFLTVATKTGETRYYGLSPKARVQFPHSDSVHPNTIETAIWALDRVVDAWGNYYDVHYNDDQADFGVRGLIVTRIDYTGHFVTSRLDGSSQQGATAPFHSITFGYNDGDRPDVRRMRFAANTVPKVKRLTSIATPLGTYALSYLPDGDPLLPSRLSRIDYCASGGAPCLDPLVFYWEGGGYGWQEVPHAATVGQANSFELPDRIDTTAGCDVFKGCFRYPGTQFVDLNGDGRLDFVKSISARAPGDDSTVLQTSHAWLNNGNGWTQTDSLALPAGLVDPSGAPMGTNFADIDGDGWPDLIAQGATPLCSPGGDGKCFRAPAIWYNRGNRWVPDDGLLGAPTVPSSSATFPRDTWGVIDLIGKDSLADMNGDGRADLVRVDYQAGRVLVLLNVPDAGWVDAGDYYNAPLSAQEYQLARPLHFVDINRDGLADLTTSTGQTGWMNEGPGGARAFTTAGRFSGPANVTAPQGTRFTGDVDGDGYLDSVSVAETVTNPGVPTGVFLSSGGFGFAAGSEPNYIAALAPFDPLNGGAWPNVSMADVNGDGLLDVVAGIPARHSASYNVLGAVYYSDPGFVLLNTGRTWTPLNLLQVPVVPNDIVARNRPEDQAEFGELGFLTSNGGAFVDLNGDGLVDLVESNYHLVNDGQNGSPRVSRAWLNTFKRPVIKAFPNGIARNTQVGYTVLTSAEARSQGTYTDSIDVASGTTHFMAPLRVVASLQSDDGLNTSSLATTLYFYDSLRGSANGRGPQGFRSVVTSDQRSGINVATTYAQAYPYTGLPTSVARFRFGQPSGTPISQTTTTYCDTVNDLGQGPLCSPMSGVALDSAETSRFIYPVSVVDESFPPISGGGPAGPAVITTTTQLRYDNAGNVLKSLVRTTSETGETYEKLTENTYASEQNTSSRIPLRLGKLTQAIVTSERLQPADPSTRVQHVTAFDYATPWVYADAGVGGQNNNIPVLMKKRIEPNAASTGAPVELHTAYDFDGFGNVILTKECASDFDTCDQDPAHVGPASLPFRTVATSYVPTQFVAPVGRGLIGALNYGPGRFPVRTTNAAGHMAYMAYDPIRGGLVQETGPNGISSCHSFDPFGRQDSETARCGSDGALTTTTNVFRVMGGDTPLAKAVSVTRSPTGETAWTYVDALNRKIATRKRAFDGRFTEVATSYDSMGRLETESKPSFLGDPAFTITTDYDAVGRIHSHTQPLDEIRGPGTGSATSLVVKTYAGLTNHADETVGGVTRRRSETKNALGKVAAVTADGTTTTYEYDGDANLRFVRDPAGNVVEMQYDVRGRKIKTIDPDVGSWTYAYNGFGDLVSQTDAKSQTTTMTYDVLGRMVSKTDAQGTAQWVYDAEPGGIGKLVAMVSAPDGRLAGPCTIPHTILTGGNRAGRSFKYTRFGEVEEITECADGGTFASTYQYDRFGRQSQVKYPPVNGKRLVVGYHYTSLGYLHYLSDDSNDHGILWQSVQQNAFGDLLREQARNGVETVATRNPSTNWLMTTKSRANFDGEKLIQDWGFTYDEAGNLLTRSRADQARPNPSLEAFTYDSLDRVKTSRVTVPLQGYDRSESFDYDSLGNLTLKDSGAYSYNAGCLADTRPAGPHAVCTVAGGARYVYDANGNLTSGGARTMSYTLGNKVAHIASGAGSVDVIYGADGSRVVQDAGSQLGRTVYVGLGATGHSLYERTTTSTGTEHVHYVYAGSAHGGNPFALRVVAPDGSTTATKYYAFDHLGSVTALSDELGRVATSGPNADVLGYDPWGARREPDGREAPGTSFGIPVGRREYTGHERIPSVGLVNMNGRVYDPVLGRFLSPDPNVQFTANLQSYNRYAYVLNNPLRATDPTGYFLDERTGVSGLDFTISFGLTVAGVAACATGYGCAVTALAAVYWRSAVMASEGASFGQVLAVNGVSLFVGVVSGGAAQVAGKSFAAALVIGAASSAGSYALTTYATGGHLSGTDLLLAAAEGGAMAGFAWGFAPTAKLSEASAAEAQGDEMGPPASPGAQQHWGEHQRLQSMVDQFRAEYDAGNSAAARAVAKDAINLARDVYDIDVSAATGGVQYEPRLTRTGRFVRETKTIQIGPKAFSTAGFLGSVVDHEAYHASVLRDLGPLPYATKKEQALVEIPVYDHTLGTDQVRRFGLLRFEVQHLEATREIYLRDLYGPGS